MTLIWYYHCNYFYHHYDHIPIVVIVVITMILVIVVIGMFVAFIIANFRPSNLLQGERLYQVLLRSQQLALSQEKLAELVERGSHAYLVDPEVGPWGHPFQVDIGDA